MKILFGKSNWEARDLSLEDFLRRAKTAGFDAVEIFLPALKESDLSTLAKRTEDEGLSLVAQILTEGRSADEHIACFEHLFALAAACRPLFVNSHTGRDVFSLEDNLKIFRRTIELSKAAGILLTHETHRRRPTFSGPSTRVLLEALPELRINADFSHWFCVHESDLSDQPENVELAIAAASYIHARVGFEEGPQIADPSAPEWKETVEKFFNLWKRIIAARQADGTPFLVITPEFGPPPYMPCEPFTRRPLADAWDVNTRFLPVLKKALAE